MAVGSSRNRLTLQRKGYRRKHDSKRQGAHGRSWARLLATAADPWERAFLQRKKDAGFSAAAVARYRSTDLYQVYRKYWPPVYWAESSATRAGRKRQRRLLRLDSVQGITRKWWQQMICVLKEELGIKNLATQVKVGDARSWAIAAMLSCQVNNQNSSAAMLNLCCLGSSVELAQLHANVIADAIRVVGCFAERLRSILLYLSLTVEDMEARLQAGGAQWIGKEGGLHGMGPKTTAVVKTYYLGEFDFVVDTNVHSVFVDAEMAPVPRGKGGARYPDPGGLINVSGAANQLHAELTQQLRDVGVSKKEAWEGQLLMNMLGHRHAKYKLGQYFTDVLFE